MRIMKKLLGSRKLGLDILLAVLCLTAVSCTGQTGSISSGEVQNDSRPLSTVKESKDLSLLDEIENLNHNFAKYEGNIYYRQYYKDSFEPGGTNKSYESINGTDKEMMCIGPDGSKKAMFTDQGNGGFYILQSRIYMTEKADDASIIYSVDMNGKNRREYGIGYIRAANEDKNVLIIEITESAKEDFYNDFKLCIVDAVSGEMQPLKMPENKSESFLAYIGGRIYFQQDESAKLAGEDDAPKVTKKLCSILPDGTDEIILAEVSGIARYKWEIQKIQIVDEIIFFSYGGYDGSAGTYQGGGIASVRTDGTDFQIIDEGYSEGNCVSNRFYVQKTEDDMYIHYNNQFEMTGIHMVARKLSSGELYSSNLPSQSGEGPGVLFTGDISGYGEADSVYVILDYTGNIVEICDSIRSKVPNNTCKEQTVTTNIRNLAYMDGYLYFTYEASILDSAFDRGWREGFRRVETASYRLKTADDSLELLFSY